MAPRCYDINNIITLYLLFFFFFNAVTHWQYLCSRASFALDIRFAINASKMKNGKKMMISCRRYHYVFFKPLYQPELFIFFKYCKKSLLLIFFYLSSSILQALLSFFLYHGVQERQSFLKSVEKKIVTGNLELKL